MVDLASQGFMPLRHGFGYHALIQSDESHQRFESQEGGIRKPALQTLEASDQ